MRTWIVLIGSGALFGLPLLGLQEARPQQAPPPAQPPTGCCGGCGMMKQMGPESMKQMGMQPGAMERMQLLMRVPVFLDSPVALQVQAEKLGLSEDQKKKLSEVEREARERARAVLSPEQRTKLGEVPEKPMVMMQMCPCPMMGSGTTKDAQEAPRK